MSAKEEQLKAKFFKACGRGDVDEVKSLIANGLDAEVYNGFYDSGFHFAKTIPMAELLFYEGVDINGLNQAGCSPIEYAVIEYDFKIVDAFITKFGADVNVVCKDGDSLLHLALRRRKDPIKVASRVLSAGVSANVKNIYGITPFHDAAARCLVDFFPILRENGGQANQRNYLGNTPFHLLMRNRSTGKSEINALLAVHGSPNILNKDGLNPLQYTVRERSYNLQAAKAFLDLNVSLDITDKVFGRSLVHDVILASDYDLLVYLIDMKNVGFNVVDNQGKTPLDYCGFDECVDKETKEELEKMKKIIIESGGKTSDELKSGQQESLDIASASN